MSRNLLDVDWSAIPTPVDDGGASHLISGTEIPRSILLESTAGPRLTVNLGELTGTTVIYIYPRTGRPDQELPPGWDAVPGARGCTPQSCSFRDHASQLHSLGVSRIFGLSTQDTAYQKEAVDRLHLPFALLSDNKLLLTEALRLPTFVLKDSTLLKRITIIIKDGVIRKIFYPVFPPNASALEVIKFLKSGQHHQW